MTRILIADDSPSVRQGIRALLQGHAEWEVCAEAIDGRDAVQKTRESMPDVIVLDFFMPGINGIEAVREIKQICPKVSILLCSMYLDSQLARLGRDAGVAGFLSKSNVGQVPQAIEALLRGETFFASQI